MKSKKRLKMHVAINLQFPILIFSKAIPTTVLSKRERKKKKSSSKTRRSPFTFRHLSHLWHFSIPANIKRKVNKTWKVSPSGDGSANDRDVSVFKSVPRLCARHINWQCNLHCSLPLEPRNNEQSAVQS